MADKDEGFVLDEASGLYFHARSGFYHDPSAGWYYNTQDGVYYTFDDGMYVPIVLDSESGGAITDVQSTPIEVGTESGNQDEQGQNLLKSQVYGPSKPSDDTRCAIAPASGVYERSPESAASQWSLDLKSEGSLVEDEHPLWYYDKIRSIHWYFDKGSRAYYMYRDENYGTMEETGVQGDMTVETTNSHDQQMAAEDTISYVANGGEVDTYQSEKPSNDGDNEDSFKPTSGWVEEALIDLYLKGYPCESSDKDEGPWITSADIFSENPKNDPSFINSYNRECTHHYSSSVENDTQWSANSCSYDTNGFLPFIHESDNDGSEELEEGEWVPDEPLRIVDAEGETSTLYEGSMNENASKSNIENRTSGRIYEEGEIENSEFGQDNGDTACKIDIYESCLEEEINQVDNQRREEERWQAQFGQVVREKPREYVIPGVVDLWDWMIVDKEVKTSKQSKWSKMLAGRIVSSVTKLHPSLSASSGLIRTSAICAAELDFVKVSSGKIYRLRRPSSKQITSSGIHDSSNPTKEWGLPSIGLALLDTSGALSLENGTAAHEQTKSRADSLVSKPFIPNTGHWRFQHLIAAKKGRGVAPALLASKVLSPEELLMHEERKQRYRDRAAERRNLHGGFGIGPGQKTVSAHEQEKLDADEAVGMVGALEKAAAAPPLGRDNVGKRMLEGMGWKEGQTLGVEGGLVTPLQAQGNLGRAGLGWT